MNFFSTTENIVLSDLPGMQAGVALDWLPATSVRDLEIGAPFPPLPE